MGYVPPPPPPDYMATMYTVARIYDIGSQLLGSRVRQEDHEPNPIYAARTWADLHLEQMGWGVLFLVFALVLFVAWLGVR